MIDYAYMYFEMLRRRGCRRGMRLRRVSVRFSLHTLMLPEFRLAVADAPRFRRCRRRAAVPLYYDTPKMPAGGSRCQVALMMPRLDTMVAYAMAESG